MHKPHITQCKQLIERDDWEIKITHYYREANQVAEKLANLGLDNDIGVVYFNSPPTEMCFMQML